MRALAGALELAHRSGRRLSYLWPTKPPGVECELSDLWKFTGGRALAPNQFLERFAETPHLSNDTKTWTDEERGRDTWLIWTSDVVELDGPDSEWRRNLADLRPSNAVEDQLGALRTQIQGRPYVGVQVRSSAATHEKTVQHSPLSWFERRMDEIVEKEPDTLFFLSCDTREGRERLSSRGHHVVSQDHNHRYNSKSASIAAVADLHMLAASQHLVGPYWSSFVDLAWDMAGRSMPREDSLRTWLPGDERPRLRK